MTVTRVEGKRSRPHNWTVEYLLQVGRDVLGDDNSLHAEATAMIPGANRLLVHGYCTKLSQTLTVCTSIERAFIRRLSDMGNGYWWNLILLKNAICI
ncbi:hypothetical protein G6F43_012731 [Rhizopus delemar]|nr:hypothetical protein G6F43_012731 [Rhizopus delemar]